MMQREVQELSSRISSMERDPKPSPSQQQVRACSFCHGSAFTVPAQRSPLSVEPPWISAQPVAMTVHAWTPPPSGSPAISGLPGPAALNFYGEPVLVKPAVQPWTLLSVIGHTLQ